MKLIHALAFVLVMALPASATEPVRLSATSEDAYKASITAMSAQLTRQDLQLVIQHLHDVIFTEIEIAQRLNRAEAMAYMEKNPDEFWLRLKNFAGKTAQEIVDTPLPRK
jgi:hypothetical protein